MKIFVVSFLTTVVCFGILGLVESTCNIEIVADTDAFNISSPGYPFANYPNNIDCWWKVSAKDKHSNVAIQVLFADIEQSTNCVYDRLSVYDGFNSTAPLLGRICGTTKTSFISKGDALFIRFTSDASNTARGFLARIFTVGKCGGELTATRTNSKLVSPGYPNSYFNNMYCVWSISAENENDTVILEVIDSEVEQDSQCLYDKISVYNGDVNSTTESDAVLGKFCGNDRPIFQSSLGAISVIFTTDNSVQKKGFSIRYYTVAANNCTRRLTGSYHPLYIVTPGFPDMYYSDLKCKWTIVAPNYQIINSKVILTIESDDTEETPNCTVDSLAVEVFSPHSITKFCGNKTATIVAPDIGAVIATFRSGSENSTGAGIKMRYQLVSTTYTTMKPPVNCGPSNLTARYTPQALQSPNYPFGYQNDEDCVWTIKARNPGYMVQITVLDSDLEQSDTCQYDYVKVYDGTTRSSNMIQTWCGYMTPTIQSSRSALTLWFHTDGSNTYRGFNLSYVETNVPYQCGGNLQASTSGGVLTSPGYPAFYRNNLDCVWHITAASGFNIQIDVLDTNIEYSSSCNYDYVEVDDGSFTSSNTLSKFCGTTTPTLVSSSNAVTITFHTDNSHTDQGFELRYTAGTFSACGEQDLVAYVTSTDLTSPNYPYNYPNNANCKWRLDTQDSDFVVSINVITSDMEYSTGCYNDYVEAFDGYSDDATSLGRWCGYTAPNKHSSGRYMYLKFVSDSSDTRTGFKISYTAELKDDFYSSNAGAIAGGTVGGVCFIFIIVAVLAGAASRKKSRPTVTTVGNNRAPGNVYTVNQGPYETTVTRPAAFQPPPPYTQVVNAEQSRPVGSAAPPQVPQQVPQQAAPQIAPQVPQQAPPPAYVQQVNSSDTTPILSQQVPPAGSS